MLLHIPPFNFKEQRNQVYSHNLKIFIMGTDVTPWITSQVTLQRADRDGINLLSFSLSNANRAFEMTEENLGSISVRNSKRGTSQKRTGTVFRLSDPYSPEGKYSELAKARIFKIKTRDSFNTLHQVDTFGGVAGSGVGGKKLKTPLENANDATSSITDRFPMTLGSLVFHKYDPIRFFVANPLSRGRNEWTCEFTGYINTKPFTQNYTTGDSVINITCQDIRALMQIMRVQVNPMSQVGNENTLFFGRGGKANRSDRAESGFFNDLLKGGSNLSHVLANQSFINTIKTLLFGVLRTTKNKEGKKTTSRSGRVGRLTEGVTLEYDLKGTGTKEPRTTLRNWTNLINFGTTPLVVKESTDPQVPEGATTNADGTEYTEPTEAEFTQFPQAGDAGTITPRFTFLTLAEMYSLGRATVLGELGSPDNAQVHFLVPAAGTPQQNLIEFSTVDARGVAARVEWSTRLELLLQVCKSIDYQFYVTGMGDIIFEFPMYDFLPPDFGDVYGDLYTFKDHLISDSINDEGGSPITALEVTSRKLRQETQGPETGGDTSAQVALGIELKRTIFSNVLASRIGVHVETYSIPGISGEDGQARLAQMGYIEFNKRLANYNQFTMVTSFRPYIGVNRPAYHVRKARMGIIRSVTYTWRIRAEVTLEMDLLYTRRLEGDLASGQGTFRFITGGERQPISYRTIYDGVRVKGQGVTDSGEPDADTTNVKGPSDPKETGAGEAGE